MTQQNLVSLNIPADKMQNIETAIKTLQTDLMPYLKSLSPAERKELSKMGDKTFSFVQKSLEHAAQNPELVPAFLDLEEFKKDMEAFTSLRNMFNSISQIATLVDDTDRLAGSDSFAAALVFYSNIKTAAKIKAPKANDIYNDLSARFPGRNSKNINQTEQK